MNPIEFKEKIERETGLKVSMRIPRTGSMKGFAIYTPKTKERPWPKFPFEYVKGLQKDYKGYFLVDDISVFFGESVFEYIKTKEKRTTAKQLTHVQSMYVPPYARDETYFMGYTTNYGRKKGQGKGSGGWGIGPNIVHGWYKLTPDNLERYAIGCKFVYLGNGEKYYFDVRR